jgi:hypothetical protein
MTECERVSDQADNGGFRKLLVPFSFHLPSSSHFTTHSHLYPVSTYIFPGLSQCIINPSVQVHRKTSWVLNNLLDLLLSSCPPRNGKIRQVLEIARTSVSENGAIDFGH